MISNHILSKVWDEITYLFLNFNGAITYLPLDFNGCTDEV